MVILSVARMRPKILTMEEIPESPPARIAGIRIAAGGPDRTTSPVAIAFARNDTLAAWIVRLFDLGLLPCSLFK